MSSTAVVNPVAGLTSIASAMIVLREQLAAAQLEPDFDPALRKTYHLIDRDLAELTAKTEAVAWGWGGTPQDAAGLLRVSELATPDRVALMARMTDQLSCYIRAHGVSVDKDGALDAVARRMRTTVDEIYQGLAYGEQVGLLSVSPDRRTLTCQAAG